ncbi:MAG: hypothetical protein K9M81_00580 [Chthoniobacterales bacterium]|nr:hypothetical protein [Chthoniobacterales bacterium]
MDDALGSCLDLDNITLQACVKIRVYVDSLAPARLALSGLPKGSPPAVSRPPVVPPSAFAVSSSRSV